MSFIIEGFAQNLQGTAQMIYAKAKKEKDDMKRAVLIFQACSFEYAAMELRKEDEATNLC